MGGTIKGAQFPGDKSRPDRSGRQREQDHPVEQSPRWPAARQSVQEVNGHKPATRRVEFEGVKDRDARDVDITYRMCCITVGTSPSLFDMGANASNVNRRKEARMGSCMKHYGVVSWNINE